MSTILMNKLILISLIIFFTICSKSWAGELDGKTLICNWNKVYDANELDTKIGYHFKDGFVQGYYIRTNYMNGNYWELDDDTRKFIYFTDPNFIRWDGWYVNRKTLEIKNNVDYFGNCEVVDFKIMINRMKIRIDQLNKKLDKEKQGNKI